MLVLNLLALSSLELEFMRESNYTYFLLKLTIASITANYQNINIVGFEFITLHKSRNLT